MDFFDFVSSRQSVRAYTDKTVERPLIEKCIEAARLAPSACNSQPWHFIVVDKPELKAKISECATNKMLKLNLFADQPPVMVVMITEAMNLTAKLGAVVKSKNYNLIDTGIAAEHFCLQAHELGLGTCMMGWFDEAGVKKLLGIPKTKRINLIISVGYAPDDYKLRTKIRKDTKEILSYNAYK